jgi:hypothetical protein
MSYLMIVPSCVLMNSPRSRFHEAKSRLKAAASCRTPNCSRANFRYGWIYGKTFPNSASFRRLYCRNGQPAPFYRINERHRACSSADRASSGIVNLIADVPPAAQKISANFRNCGMLLYRYYCGVTYVRNLRLRIFR